MASTSLVASVAGATESDDKYRLVWIRGTNAAQCSEQSVIEQQVRLRLDRDPFESDANRIIQVFVSSNGALWHVHLVVLDNTGKALGQRVLDVTADNCGEVATAVGLAIALAIDPNVSLVAKAPEATSTPGVRSTAALPSPGPDAKSQPSATLTRLSAPDQHPQKDQTPNVKRPELDRNAYQYELTLRAVGATGVLPKFAGGTSVAGSFGRSGTRLMMALTYLPESTSDARFSFGFAAASGGVCGDVVRLRLLTTTVCGEFALGAIHSVVHQLEPIDPGDRVTAMVGLGPKLGWHAWAPLFIELGVSGWVGLVRPKFALVNTDSTRNTVYQSRAVSGIGFIGVGVTTP